MLLNFSNSTAFGGTDPSTVFFEEHFSLSNTVTPVCQKHFVFGCVPNINLFFSCDIQGIKHI